ncbi:hypothetical protein PTTG_30102 [Puccinia triticina 1-1 BBBD Race 1]|uniref:CCHC-type domain-containing protein n=1 Tax=Puccinia triticina (isolate 1-1 / race 1 (BBBD)) TaxID=630390 RepID=A0A180G0H3_PUCT1|nr:hypothetical protein PTTG_30102 [Puccinia triticina 1-1 BBBD Race 1]
MELMDKLLELRISGPSTDPSQIPGLFNKLFNIFSDLQKVGATLSPLVESLILQSIVPPPASMSRFQSFQNISLQLGTKANVTARDIQTIITSANQQGLNIRQINNNRLYRSPLNNATKTLGLRGIPLLTILLWRGNTGPNNPNLLSGRPCLYCGISGHWRLTCPTLRRDAGLQLPNTPVLGRPASGNGETASLQVVAAQQKAQRN